MLSAKVILQFKAHVIYATQQLGLHHNKESISIIQLQFPCIHVISRNAKESSIAPTFMHVIEEHHQLNTSDDSVNSFHIAYCTTPNDYMTNRVKQ